MLTALKCTLGTITIFGIGFVTGVLAWDKFLWDELMSDLDEDEYIDSSDDSSSETELTSNFVKNTEEYLKSDNSCGCSDCSCKE